MRVLVLQGPNLQALGKREPAVYGTLTLQDIVQQLEVEAASLGVVLTHLQSNHEGALIDALHRLDDEFDGCILNAGAFTHTSVALRDAIASQRTPVIEVHLSNIFARESFRHHSMIAPVCRGSISGLGALSYVLALRALTRLTSGTRVPPSPKG